jgi:hypothetical protein
MDRPNLNTKCSKSACGLPSGPACTTPTLFSAARCFFIWVSLEYFQRSPRMESYLVMHDWLRSALRAGERYFGRH